jgi:DNA-binding CsgD family transcriptional regulator
MAGDTSRPEREVMSFVGRMYDAAVSPILWDGILEDLAREFRSEFAVLTMHDRTTFEVVFNSYYNIEHWATLEWAKVARHDPAVPAICNLINRVEHCRSINTTEEIHSSIFYKKLMRPHGIEFRMGVHCDVHGSVGAYLSVFRSPDNRSYTELDKKRFGPLVPHFGRAMRIQHLLSGSFAAGGMLKRVIDNLPFSVVVVDAQLRLLFSNRAATSLAEQRRGISLRHTMLYAGDELSNRHLRRAVGLVIRTNAARGMQLQRDGRRPLSLWIASLDDLSDPGGLAPVAIFIMDPDLHDRTDPDFVMTLLNLTRAEAELVTGLVDGNSLQAVARQRGVTEGTARQQLKSVFSKLDCRSQPELVAAVLRHPMWLAHHAGQPAG